MKCLNCNKELTRYQTKYCSNKCQKEQQYKEYIVRWQQGLEIGLKGQFGISNHIKHYLLEKHNYKCEKCGWGEINPYTQTLPLEAHHKDGDYRNNTEENLELLCPNCHSLTDSYKGANSKGREDRENYVSRKNYCVDCGAEIASTSTRCRKCASKMNQTEKPVTREELKLLIRTKPFTQIATMFQVSDTAIRKWCDFYNLPRKVTDIKKYSDIEWEKI